MASRYRCHVCVGDKRGLVKTQKSRVLWFVLSGGKTLSVNPSSSITLTLLTKCENVLKSARMVLINCSIHRGANCTNSEKNAGTQLLDQ